MQQQENKGATTNMVFGDQYNLYLNTTVSPVKKELPLLSVATLFSKLFLTTLGALGIPVPVD